MDANLHPLYRDHQRIFADYPRGSEGIDAMIATAVEEPALAVRSSIFCPHYRDVPHECLYNSSTNLIIKET